MAATMAKQGGWVQLEQSDMRLALNVAIMAKEGFLRAAMEDTLQQIKKPCAEVWEEKKWIIVFPGHKMVNGVLETHPAMIGENQTDGCLPCQNWHVKSAETCWRHEATGAPQPRRAPPPPGMPPASSDDSEGTQCFETEGVPPGYVHIHTPLLGDQSFNLDPHAKDCMRNKDFIPDLLTDEGPSTGKYIISCGLMQLTDIS